MVLQYGRLFDFACGEALMKKTPAKAWDLIQTSAKYTQQFSSHEKVPIKEVSEVNSPSVQQQALELNCVFRQLVVGVGQAQVKACGICCNVGHPTDACPTLHQVDVRVVGFVPRRDYDPFSNTYNRGWCDYPNFHYGNSSTNTLRFANQ